MFVDRGTPSTSGALVAGPPISSSSPDRPSSSFSVTRSIASPRSASLTIRSKIRRCASRKKSAESIISAARLKASLCSRIAPSTERSASRLCGSVRSIATTFIRSGAGKAECTKNVGVWALPKLRREFQFRNSRRLLLLAAFGDDLHLHVRRHVAMQLHRHFELTDLLDRLRQVQPALVDVEAFGDEDVGDVAARDRSIECFGLADLARDLDLDVLQPAGDGFGDVLLLELFRVELDALALDLFLVALGREQRQLARQQVVAGVAVGDLDDLAAAPEVVDVFSQNHFHDRPQSVT